MSIKLKKKAKIIFALGGPGTGKGTHCINISKKYGFVHLSAGDLLRKEIKENSENSRMINRIISEGKIVPVEVTVDLLLKQILKHQKNNKNLFLID
ncbi:UMP-CMP kinase 3, partial [Bonamia ostreae]